MREARLTEFSTHSIERLHQARAFIFDMDGTLVLGDAKSGGHRPLPGAVALIGLLRARGLPFRVFTNGTAKSPADYAASLRQGGLHIDDHELMTPSTCAADWFKRRGIGRVRVLGNAGAQAPLREAGIDVIEPGEPATRVEAVYTAWYREFGFNDLELACRDIWNGAVLTTASNVPFFATHNGRGIGSSYAINAMLRAMTQRAAKVLGKPSREALHCALRQMKMSTATERHTVVVGDDPALEMRMARRAGAFALAVATGLTDAETFSGGKDNEKPDAVVHDLQVVADALAHHPLTHHVQPSTRHPDRMGSV